MRILNQQWEDSLRGERYPFAGTGALRTVDGLELDQDVILDLNLMVDQQTTEVFLQQIVVEQGVSAAATFTLADGTAVGTVALWPAPAAVVPVLNGTLTVGYLRLDPLRAEVLMGWATSTHLFSDVAVLPHLLVVSDKRWRQGFELPDGTVLTGDVYLVADRELWLERTTAGFRVHVTGDPFAGRTVPARGLKTLNGVAPVDGNVNLVGIGTGNIVAGSFVAAGQAFRISVIPGSGVLTLDLVGGDL